HASAVRIHLTTGHRRAEPVIDHSAEDVQGGVSAHHSIAVVPVNLGAHRIAEPRECSVDGVVHIRSSLFDVYDWESRPECLQEPTVGHLPAATRIEHRAIQDD